MKVLLILIDGMRPDAMVQIPAAKKVMEKAAYKLEGRTVYPSCTLPCHMSLFYSRPPLTHGVTSNTYTARVRLKNGDYLDVGNPIGPALPVVVKTLILER